MKSSTVSRVLLDKEAREALDQMLTVLREEGKYIKINPSRLTSWVVSKFAKKYFGKSKSEIVKAHFNSKEYLKDLASNIEEDENPAEILSQALKSIQGKTKKAANAKKAQEESDAHEGRS